MVAIFGADQVNIDITTAPSEQDARTISQGIIDFNAQRVPDLERHQAEINFSVFARSDSDVVIGGVRAACYWNTLHIELLWLAEEYRGQSIGEKLIKQAENFAMENGCEKAFVETTSWQAKPFYQKMGYDHIATLPDRPKGHSSHYLIKSLG